MNRAAVELCEKGLRYDHDRKDHAAHLRKRDVLELIPVGKTKLQQDFIRTGRLKKIPLDERAFGFAEDNVEQVIAELIAAADTTPSPSKFRSIVQRRSIAADFDNMNYTITKNGKG